MRRWIKKSGAVVALLGVLALGAGAGEVRAQAGCLSWSEARSAGWIQRYNLRPASDVLASVERRYNGKVVNFVLCQQGGAVVYRLSVLQPNGNLLSVSEPGQ